MLTVYLRANSMCQCCRSHCCSKSLKQYTCKIGIWICAWNNYVSYTLVCDHFIVCSMYVSFCCTPSFSSPSFAVLQIPVLQIQLSHLDRTMWIFDIDDNHSLAMSLGSVDEFTADHHRITPVTHDVTQPAAAAVNSHVTGSGSELQPSRATRRQVEVGANKASRSA